MPNITLPYNISFEEWADCVRLDLPDIDFPYSPMEPQWRDWAERTVQIDTLQTWFVPDPHGFADWVPWAERFAEAVSAVAT